VNRPAKERKPKRCQWLHGFYNPSFSGLRRCKEEPVFEVHANGVCVGWVCGRHVQDVIQMDFKIR
jgi:hypothetical protein